MPIFVSVITFIYSVVIILSTEGLNASAIEGTGMTEVLLLASPLYSNRAQPLGSSCREAARPCFEKCRWSCNAMLRMEVVLAALFGCFPEATVAA